MKGWPALVSFDIFINYCNDCSIPLPFPPHLNVKHLGHSAGHLVIEVRATAHLAAKHIAKKAKDFSCGNFTQLCTVMKNGGGFSC